MSSRLWLYLHVRRTTSARAGDRRWMGPSRDADPAGSAPLNFAVDDLDQHVADVSGRGLTAGAIETVNKGVQLSAIRDPDGNLITFIGTSASSTENGSRREPARE
jgi:hypothetical protein